MDNSEKMGYLLMVILFLPSCAISLQAFDCEDEKSLKLTKFDATEIEPCVNTVPSKLKEKNETVYVINENLLKKTTVIQCKIKVTRTIQVSS